MAAPRIASTAVMASPIGPHPTTTATSPSCSPARATACTAMPSGSTGAAAVSGTDSSTFRHSASLSARYSA